MEEFQTEPDAKEAMKDFLDSFQAYSHELQKELCVSSKLTAKELPHHFEKISDKLQKLQSSLNDSIKFMRLYDVRVCQEKMKYFQTELDEQQSKLLPKKKFAFKSRRKETEKHAEVSVSDITDGPVQVIDKSIVCGFENRFGERLEKSDREIRDKDVGLRKLEKCEVILRGSASTMHASALRNCHIFCGPVKTSIFVEDCTDCVFVLSCQQLRIHASADCEFYLQITSGPVIEDSVRIGFAPFAFPEHDSVDSDTGDSAQEPNNWNLVNDFNWLAADMASPNWHVILQADRKQLFNSKLF